MKIEIFHRGNTDTAPAVKPVVLTPDTNRASRRSSGRKAGVGTGLVGGVLIGATLLGGGIVLDRTVLSNDHSSTAVQPATPGTSAAAGQNPDATILTLPDGSIWGSGLLDRIAAAQSAASSGFEASASASASSNENLGAKIAPGVELPAVISSDMIRAFTPNVAIDGNLIPQYVDSEFFLPVYNAAHAGKKDNYVGIGPWAPIAIQNLTGKAHLKTEGNPGLFDVVADKPGQVAIYFTQLGAHQHETAVNGNGESNPDWKNQYTLHLKPYQTVKVIDRNGNQVLWDENTKAPMNLAASKTGDFSIEVPRTADNENVIFGLVIDVNPSQVDVQATAIKVQRGPNDVPDKTGENKFSNTKTIIIPAIAEK